MSTENRWNNIPDELKQTDKSFIKKIESDTKRGSVITQFHAFPYKVHLDGQEPTEHIILLLRQHWIVLLKPMLIIALLILISMLTFPYANTILDNPAMAARYAMSASILLWIIAFTLGISSFVKWFFTIDIVTDERVVDLDFFNPFRHNYAETSLDRIEDVSHAPSGALSALFDYGTLTIQTAGARVDIEFDNIPRPRDVQDVLQDLIALRKSK